MNTVVSQFESYKNEIEKLKMDLARLEEQKRHLQEEQKKLEALLQERGYSVDDIDNLISSIEKEIEHYKDVIEENLSKAEAVINEALDK